MRKKGSRIAQSIDNEYKKEKEWRKRLLDRKSSFIILAEHSREPLIIEKEEESD